MMKNLFQRMEKMNKLKCELEKQLLYCRVMDKFRAAVYVSSKDKIGYVKNILDDIFDNSFPVKNIRYVFNQYEFFVGFPNGSRLKIIIANDSGRGNKINGCLIDKDISNNVKRMIVYPQLFPRIISMEDFKLESWDDVKKRVVDVKIQTTENK